MRKAMVLFPLKRGFNRLPCSPSMRLRRVSARPGRKCL
jgi:hypothetical protein